MREAAMTPVTSLDVAVTRPTTPAVVSDAPQRRETQLMAALLALAKPRLTSLVVATTGVGYLLGETGVLHVDRFLSTLVGTTLVAAAASALNQLWERRWDARMVRTRERPLPLGTLSPRAVMLYATLTSGVGLAVLWVGSRPIAAVIALLTLLTYVLVYTPLKRRITLNTLVGAIPGAFPPLIGWSAATGSLNLTAGTLFAILFVWQIPHFLAISWLYREDYERAGFRMLSVVDPSGASTSRMAFLYALTLVPVSLTPALAGLTGPLYLVGAGLLGLAFLIPCYDFYLQRSVTAARRLFLASILYLPALLAVMLVDPAASLVR